MTDRYYSARAKSKIISLEELYSKLQYQYLFFRGKDYFKGKAEITTKYMPDAILNEAALDLGFQPFPITKWSEENITEDHIFDVLEFLYDHVSKPGKMIDMFNESGWNYMDYGSYDDQLGQTEFRNKANGYLSKYKNGYELSDEGNILALGTEGIQYILDAEIIPYDEQNVDKKVRDAITKWRNRKLSVLEKKEAIRELADVFEWLKKTKGLSKVLNEKDESAIFELANKFSIRHHNPDQINNYDKNIWYSWIFHFYLATYHAVIRLLIKKEKDDNSILT